MRRRILAGGVLAPAAGSHRAACLGPWLAHMRRLDPGQHELSWTFVVDGPDTLDGQRALRAAFPAAHLLICSARRDEIMAEDRAVRHAPLFRRMAYLRNLLRERVFLDGADFLLSVDGDVLPPPGLLVDLAEQDRPVCAGLVCNRPDEPGSPPPRERLAWNVMDFSADAPTRDAPIHFPPDFGAGGPCDVTGACCLYREDALRASRWAPDACGEDVGFGRRLRASGARAWYRPVECPHAMTPAMLAVHRASCATCAAAPAAI